VKNIWESILELYPHHQVSAEMKVKLGSKIYNFVVMPHGMTSQLQPLHVPVNNPLKD
jgi:hypothetical protein